MMKYRFNNFELDKQAFELTSPEGERVEIEPLTFNLLLYLLENRNRIIGKQELLEQLWPGKVVTEASLSTCIKAARQAVNDNGQQQHTIATRHRRGYHFVADVKVNETNESTTAPDKTLNLKATKDDRLALVVIPFSHKPNNQNAAWWADVFTQEISMQLARISGYMVISSHSVPPLRTSQASIQSIGKTLGTQYVIDGKVNTTNQGYQVSIQLIATESGQLLWANQKNLTEQEIEDFQYDVVQKLVAQIEPELNKAELTILRQRKPSDLGAWSRCREAGAVMAQKGWTKESFAEVAELLRDAVQRDPGLAFAHAYLSLTIALGHLLGLVEQSDWLEEASQEAEMALALDTQNSDVLGYAGCAFADMQNYERGIPLLERAIELNPSNAAAWAAIGAAKMRTGHENGAEDMRKGIQLSPRDSRLAAWGAVLARGLLSYQRVPEAIEAAKHACQYDDKIFLPRVVLAIAYNYQGRIQESIHAWKEAQRILPGLTLNDIGALASETEIQSLKENGIG